MIAVESQSSRAAYFALVRLGHPDVSKADIEDMVLQGHTNEGIAQELDLSPASVKRYRSEIRRKLKEEAEKDD